jgi:hypothetical protein
MAGLGSVQQARELPDVGARMSAPYQGGRLKGAASDQDPLWLDAIQNIGINIDEAAKAATRFYISERDKLNRIELNNEIQKAELEWDAWNNRALNGDTTGVITNPVEYLENVDNDTPEDISGLSFVEGKSASQCANAYRQGSTAAMGTILSRLSPAARDAVEGRFKETQLKTFASLTANGYAKYKRAVEAESELILNTKTMAVSKEVARDIQLANNVYDGEIKRLDGHLNDEVWMTGEVNKKYAELHSDKPLEGKAEKAERERIKGEIVANLNSQKQSAERTKTLNIQTIGANWRKKLDEVEKDYIAVQCDKYDVSPDLLMRDMDSLSESERDVRKAIETNIISMKEKNAFSLLNSVVENGDKNSVAFLDDVLEGEDAFGRLNEWGIENPAYTNALKEATRQRKTALSKLDIAKNKEINLQVSDILALAYGEKGYGTSGWKYGDDKIKEMNLLIEAYKNQGDYESAAALQNAISKRQSAEETAVKFQKQELEKQEEAKKAAEAKAIKEGEQRLKAIKAERLAITKENEKQFITNLAISLEDSVESGVPLYFEIKNNETDEVSYVSGVDLLQHAINELKINYGSDVDDFVKSYTDKDGILNAFKLKEKTKMSRMALGVMMNNLPTTGIKSIPEELIVEGKIVKYYEADRIGYAQKKVDIFKNVRGSDISGSLMVGKDGSIKLDDSSIFMKENLLVGNYYSQISWGEYEEIANVLSAWGEHVRNNNPTYTDKQVEEEMGKLLNIVITGQQNANALEFSGLTTIGSVEKIRLAEERTVRGDLNILLDVINKNNNTNKEAMTVLRKREKEVLNLKQTNQPAK